MAVNQSKFIKELTTIPTLAAENYLILADGSSSPVTSIKSYKATLADVGAYIGENVLVAPVVISDEEVFVESVGEITISGSTGTLTSSVDHSALEVGTILVLPGYPSTVVQAVGTYPYITVIPSIDISIGIEFFYGKATLSTLDASDNVINTLSYGGITSVGTLLVVGPSEIAEASYFNSGGLSVVGETFVSDAVRCSTYTSYPGVGYCDIRSAYDVNIVQRNVDNGMVTYYHRPFLNATLSTDQTCTINAWNPVAFTVIDGTDSWSSTKYRNAIGSPLYDTTNYAFAVPYGDDYPESAYMVNCQVLTEVKVGTGDLFYLDIFAGNSATGDQTILAECYYKFNFSLVNQLFTFNVSRMVYLRPYINSYHRWIRVKVYLATGPAGTLTVKRLDESTYSNIVCLG